MGTTDQHDRLSEQADTRHWEDSLWFRVLLVTAVAAGIFFRLAGLGNKMYSHDEAYASLRAAGYQRRDILNSIWDGKDKTVSDLQMFLKPAENKTVLDTLYITASSGPHQSPLFYLLAHYWMRGIGYTPAMMRGLAAVFGILSIPAMYWLSMELFQSGGIARLVTILFAVSPFHVLFSQDARPYSLWTFATLLSSASLLRAMRKKHLAAWLVYSLTLLVGIYSHQLFLLVALAHGAHFAGVHIFHHKRGYAGYVFACLFAFMVYMPWLFTVVRRWDRVEASLAWLSQPVPWSHYIQKWALIFSSPFIDFDFGFGNLIPYLLRAGVLVLIGYSFVFLVLHRPQPEKLFLLSMGILPAAALIVPDMVLGGIRSISGRYFVPVNITLILVVSIFLASRLDEVHPNARYRTKLLISVLVFASLCSNINSLLAETWWNKELSRVRPEFVEEIDRDQVLLIVSSSDSGTTLGDMLLLGFELDSDVHIRFLDSPEDFEHLSSYNDVYWFADSYLEVREASEKRGLFTREILKNILWKIETNRGDIKFLTLK